MEENRTWGGEHGSDREFHQSREYQQDTGREYGRSKRQGRYQNHEDEKRKRKWNKISRYLLGTVSGAVIIAGATFSETAPAIELTEQEIIFLQEVEQEFQENDLDGVLEILTGRNITYTSDGRVMIELENQLADIYHEICDKAAWNPEDRLAILMEGDVRAEADSNGIGFCLDGEKLYYGHLKDGLPDGVGICYRVLHNYYEYSEGSWKEGYASGRIVSGTGYYEGEEDQDYVCEWETMDGFYKDGIADGTIALTFDSLSTSEDYDYGDDITKHISYEVRNGQIIMDGHWQKDDHGRYMLLDETGRRYACTYDEKGLNRRVRTEVEWLPVIMHDGD